jgi:histone-lysine N-methyltransferase SETD1
MSRSSAGFADFFPTAPSVLQSRRSREIPGDHRTTLSRLETPDSIVDTAATSNIVKNDINGISTDGENKDDACTPISLGVNIGSTPTQSDAGLLAPGASQGTPDVGFTGRENKIIIDEVLPPKNAKDLSVTTLQLNTENGNNTSDRKRDYAKTPRTPQTDPENSRAPANFSKGCKMVYDPELDKKTPAKEKKRKPQYVDFSQADQASPSNDPRRSITNYTKGAANKPKAKFRNAPYSLRHWPFDPATSIGPEPPTQLVVTGFDPLTPVAPINALFTSFGDVAHIDNRTDPVTGRPLGICSIKFKDSASFQDRGPVLASTAARRAYYECKKEQRIGTRRVRVELDRGGIVSQRLVDKAIASWHKNNPSSLDMSMRDVSSKNNEPPPTAPKGPAARSSTRPAFNPPEGPKASTKTAPSSFIEETPILEQIKRDPYIFIAHCYVPVLSSTLPHLQKRLRTFDWKAVRCDKTGYYILFENSRRGEEETMRCHKSCHMTPLFTYIMNMESQPYGNPNYERSPSPERLRTEQKVKAENDRIRKESELEANEEKSLRAANLDPSKEVLSIVVQELKTKLLEDVKLRIAAPFLYDYLDPDRHSAKREALGIRGPESNRPNSLNIAIHGKSLPVPQDLFLTTAQALGTTHSGPPILTFWRFLAFAKVVAMN